MPYFGLKHFLGPLIRIRTKKVKGLENLPKEGAYIIVSNHISYSDPLFIIANIFPQIKRKIYFLTAEKILRFFKMFLMDKWLGMIPSNGENNNDHLKKIVENYLKKGEVCVVFPEGGIHTEKEIGKGKTGAARLALWSKLPVIPVGCSGHNGRGASNILKNLLFKKIEINISKPIYFDQYYNQKITKELLDEVTKKIMIIIGGLCDKTYPY